MKDYIIPISKKLKIMSEDYELSGLDLLHGINTLTILFVGACLNNNQNDKAELTKSIDSITHDAIDLAFKGYHNRIEKNDKINKKS